MKILAGLLFVLLLVFAGSAASAAAPELVTVESLIKAPPKQLQPIRVVGQVDRCSGFTCNLCPETMTEETYSDTKSESKCLGLSFDGFEDPNGNGDASALMERAFRFATVVMDADYDPACASEGVVCLDRVSYIVHARVAEVRSRKSALNGLGSSEGRLLAEPLARDREGMKRQMLGQDPHLDPKSIKFFQVMNWPSQTEDSLTAGLGCICKLDSCEGHWPTRYFPGLESPANPFECMFLEKRRDGWHGSWR